MGLLPSKQRNPQPTRAIPMQLMTGGGGWTVFWETEHTFGAIGWRLTQGQAAVLATKIELGEVVV